MVDSSLVPALSASLDTYRGDLNKAGIRSELLPWTGDSAEELRTAIDQTCTRQGLNGSFLVGDLPVAWYELEAFGYPERFPSDVFFMDTKAAWHDRNGNGTYDAHDSLNPRLFVSRIAGSPDEIKDYFAKNHNYRNGSLRLPRRAFLFKDDDWASFAPRSSFGLNRLYGSITALEDVSRTFRRDYQVSLEEGYESVYQWIHANPQTLYVAENDTYRTVSKADIASQAFQVQGMFYNLYNCSAARFTEANISMTLLTRTPTALATLGSTKVGGAYYSLPFYAALEEGSTWGEAFRVWYASFGVHDDGWFLGMVVQGDPTLQLRTWGGGSYRAVDTDTAPEPGHTEVEDLGKRFEVFFASAPNVL